MRLGRLDVAEANFRSSAGIDPRFPLAHFRLGQVLEKEKYREAIAELQKAVELDPTYPEPHYMLGKICRNQGGIRPD